MAGISAAGVCTNSGATSSAETGSAAQVVLHGYAPGAAQHFAAASFSLMTSTTEGQSLVLLESMAAGCVPIAYDIRYGPSELLVDGETGFLVPGGDVSALADTIERFLALPVKRVRDGALGRDLIPVLAGTGKLQLAYGALLALGLALG